MLQDIWIYGTTMLQYFMTHNRGEQEHLLYIFCYNLFTAGGVSLQGEFFFHTQVVIIKKGEKAKAYRLKAFDDG